MSGAEIQSRLKAFGIEPLGMIHYERPVVRLDFANDDTLTAIIKKTGGRWSKTLPGWYVPRSKATLARLVKAIAAEKGVDLVRDEVREMQRLLMLRSYSINTIKTYTESFSLFFEYQHGRDIASIQKREIEDYLLYLAKERMCSEATIHSMVNAIKFYYEQILKRPQAFYEIERPKKPAQIPRMFSKEQIEKILRATTNLKHKTILMICYSSGLRVSEVAALKVNAVDSSRMVINVLNAKGKKDRIVPLSRITLKYLREYYKEYRPKEYMFEGQDCIGAYSTRSIQAILSTAKKKAGVITPGSVHALRHSYATHLLDKGVDITYIQKLLGHNDLKTTLRYLHVTVRDLQRIESPLDDMDV